MVLLTCIWLGCAAPHQGVPLSEPRGPAAQPQTALPTQRVAEPKPPTPVATTDTNTKVHAIAERITTSEATVSDLTHLPIALGPNYHPWADDVYQDIAANPVIRDVPAKMRAVLEAAGDPEDRLVGLSNLVVFGSYDLAKSDLPPMWYGGGLNLVALDLHIMFYRDLAAAIAQADAPKAERLDALNRLVKMVYEPTPVGLPEPNKRLSRTITAQFVARTKIELQIEALEQSSD